jgi:hypothetical protein
MRVPLTNTKSHARPRHASGLYQPSVGTHTSATLMAAAFRKRVAAQVLGFDESIDGYCDHHGGTQRDHFNFHAANCVEANTNILALYGNAIPYNTCRNFEVRESTLTELYSARRQTCESRREPRCYRDVTEMLPRCY